MGKYYKGSQPHLMKGFLPSEQWTLFEKERLPWAAREKACACKEDRSHIKE